jgi:excisionase family DNA binding protein
MSSVKNQEIENHARKGKNVQAGQRHLLHPLTPIQAAEYLGLDVKTITRWARQGYLPAHPLGEGKRKFWRFLEGELSVWLAAKTNSSEVI